MDDEGRLAALARAAANLVEPGMVVGLGTGSTAAAFVRELGARVAAGLEIVGVPTSSRTAALARDLRIPLRTLDEVERLDLGVDGADEIAPNLDLIKGRGGALLHEKMVALACDDYVAIAAGEKLVPSLGARSSLPVEVVPFGWRQTIARLAALGVRPVLRRGTGGKTGDDVFRSDGGHFLVDCETGPIADPKRLAASVKALPGVVDHGLFLAVARRALVAEVDGTVRTMLRSV